MSATGELGKERAFPTLAIGEGGDEYGQPGMNLRTWLAGQALAGMKLTMEEARAKDFDSMEVAAVCVKLADYVLAELEYDQ